MTKEGKFEYKQSICPKGTDPFSTCKWKDVHVLIQGTDSEGKEKIISDMLVEAPAHFSTKNVEITSTKYFLRKEKSFKQLFDRVAKVQADWVHKLFGIDRKAIYNDLVYCYIHQLWSPNSPVWFNFGVEDRVQQGHACFIANLEDSLDSIKALWNLETDIYKRGSGCGVNMSNLRAIGEPISRGGSSSGLISYMEASDKIAGTIKSGGTTRRAAKLVCCDEDHPEILQFIRCKKEEEVAIKSLISLGFPSNFTDRSSALNIVRFQNTNHSVRVSDSFMSRVNDQTAQYTTRYRVDGKESSFLKCSDVMDEIATAAWYCADPGLQFKDTINVWHTVPFAGEIRSSNPCSEFLFIDNSACNLSSINLVKFKKDRTIDIDLLYKVVRLMAITMDAITEYGYYPSEQFLINSRRYRPIGIGITNLGGLLMSFGIGYGSEEARQMAAAIMSYINASAYNVGSQLAEYYGAFEGWFDNKDSMLKVLNNHALASSAFYKAYKFDTNLSDVIPLLDKMGEPINCVDSLRKESCVLWKNTLEKYGDIGNRFAQTTALAPTGTISIMLDTDTTGVEPSFALITYKKMVDGSSATIVNNAAYSALKLLGYIDEQINDIVAYIEAPINSKGEPRNTVYGAPHLLEDHYSIFDCAINTVPSDWAYRGSNSISWESHLLMVAALQPHVSGGISKTVNLNEWEDVSTIRNVYIRAWELGIKCISLYRDNCKAMQPLSLGKDTKKINKEELFDIKRIIGNHVIEPLKDSKGDMHKFKIGVDMTGRIFTVSEPQSNRLVEVFTWISKEGSTIRGLLDGFSIVLSKALQYGVPLDDLASSLVNMSFEPAGATGDPEIPFCSSIYDYIARYLSLKHSPEFFDKITNKRIKHKKSEDKYGKLQTFGFGVCPECGSALTKVGTCPQCPNCTWQGGACS